MNKLILLVIGFVMASFSALAAVNVNTATQEQLESLNGIGPAKAKAIIDYRQKNGGFKTLEDLDKVPGIGEGVLGKIKSDVTLTGASSVKAEAKPAALPAVKKAEPVKTAPAVAAPVAKPAPTATPAPAAVAPAAKAEAVDAKADKKAAAKAEKEAKKAEKDAKKAAKKAEKEAKKAEGTK